jgi:N-acyl-phosphatidylethanolamine-hydrolysing phospholipase D
MKSLKRFTPPPCEIEDIPFVDVVVISHNHYDHLSYPTVLRIAKKFPEAHFFAPLGNKVWFEKCGITNVTELDWWESRDVRLESKTPGGQADGNETNKAVSVTSSTGTGMHQGITATIGALPCQHISARTPFDKCKTLWASWSVESGGSKVFFAGYAQIPISHPLSKYFSYSQSYSDTGYRTVPRLPPSTDDYSVEYAHLPVCPAFAQIGRHRGPFDLGLIPIGAYEPRWMWSPVHADAKDAVNIFVDTKCRKALGMHWGTWVLTEEDVLEPPRKLKEALRWKGLGEEVFGVTEIGEAVEVEERKE